MPEGVKDTIRNFVEERLSSPLLPTFIISWCIWNYRFLMVTVSDLKLDEKFAAIDTHHFASAYDYLGRGIALPAISAVGFIVFYPYPAKYFFRLWRRSQVELNNLRKECDGEELLTRAEGDKLRKASEDTAKNYEIRLADLRTQLKAAQDALESLRIGESSTSPLLQGLSDHALELLRDIAEKLQKEDVAYEDHLRANKKDWGNLLFKNAIDTLSSRDLIKRSDDSLGRPTIDLTAKGREAALKLPVGTLKGNSIFAGIRSQLNT